jgi:hypothetical protein
MKRWLRLALAVLPLAVLALPTSAGADARHAQLQFADQARVVTMTVPSEACRVNRFHMSSCDWELFVNEPGQPGQPTVGIDTGTSGVLSVPYPPDFCGMLQADVLFGTPPHKEIGRRHTINTCGCPAPGRPVWPSVVTGTSPVRPQFAQGVYLGVTDAVWTLYVTHRRYAGQVFTGTITTDGTFTDVKPLKLERYDTFSQTAPNRIEFRFVNLGNLDGLSFVPTCGSRVTFDTGINGSPASPHQIFLGPTLAPAPSSPLTFTRSS